MVMSYKVKILLSIFFITAPTKAYTDAIYRKK